MLFTPLFEHGRNNAKYLKMVPTIRNNIELQETTLNYFVPSFNTIKKVVLVVHLLFNVVGSLLSFEIVYLCKRRCGLSKIA